MPTNQNNIKQQQKSEIQKRNTGGNAQSGKKGKLRIPLGYRTSVRSIMVLSVDYVISLKTIEWTWPRCRNKPIKSRVNELLIIHMRDNLPKEDSKRCHGMIQYRSSGEKLAQTKG